MKHTPLFQAHVDAGGKMVDLVAGKCHLITALKLKSITKFDRM